MELKGLKAWIEGLTDDEVAELNELLPGHTLIVGVPQCPQGYSWSSSAGACILDIG